MVAFLPRPDIFGFPSLWTYKRQNSLKSNFYKKNIQAIFSNISNVRQKITKLLLI